MIISPLLVAAITTAFSVMAISLMVVSIQAGVLCLLGIAVVGMALRLRG